MRKPDEWKPTRFFGEYDSSRWASNNIMSPGSWYVDWLQGNAYRRAIRNYVKGNVLELGCGAMPAYGWYQEDVRLTVGVDRAKNSKGTSHLDVCCDLNQGIPFRDDRFDCVLALDVLEHLLRPTYTMQEVRRVLRVGGYIIITVPFLYWVHNRPNDYWRFTEYKISHLLEGNGIEVIECTPYGGLPDVLLDLMGKPLRRWPRLSLLYFYVSKCLGSLRMTARWRNQTEDLFPLGYSVVGQRLC